MQLQLPFARHDRRLTRRENPLRKMQALQVLASLCPAVKGK